MNPITPTNIPTARPKKPNAIRPRTTPPPAAATNSKNPPTIPLSGRTSKRTMVKRTSPPITAQIKAALVTRFQ